MTKTPLARDTEKGCLSIMFGALRSSKKEEKIIQIGGSGLSQGETTLDGARTNLETIRNLPAWRRTCSEVS
jgi:hypothetical protein